MVVRGLRLEGMCSKEVFWRFWERGFEGYRVGGVWWVWFEWSGF